MLINLSNHPSPDWSEKQKAAAAIYGTVVDLPFPAVDPKRDEAYILRLARQYLAKVEAKAAKVKAGEEVAVHLMGELSFLVAMLALLQRKGFVCISSTTERIASEHGNGSKTVQFAFERFRRYVCEEE